MMQIMKALEPIIQEEVERRVKCALQVAPQLVEERAEGGGGQVITDNVFQEIVVEKPKAATKKKATETDEQKAEAEARKEMKAAEAEAKKAYKAMEMEAKKAEIAARKAEADAKKAAEKAAAKPKKKTVVVEPVVIKETHAPTTDAVAENQELQPDVIEYTQPVETQVAVKSKKTKKVTIEVAEGGGGVSNGGGVSSSDEKKNTKKAKEVKEPKKTKKAVQPAVVENEQEELADLFQGMVLETLNTIVPEEEVEEIEAFDLN